MISLRFFLFLAPAKIDSHPHIPKYIYGILAPRLPVSQSQPHSHIVQRYIVHIVSAEDRWIAKKSTIHTLGMPSQITPRKSRCAELYMADIAMVDNSVLSLVYYYYTVY